MPPCARRCAMSSSGSGRMADGSKIDPFKHIGKPASWGSFGDGSHDLEADAERRALCDYFLRRLAKAKKRLGADDGEFVPSLLSGGMVGFAGLYLSAIGIENVATEDFEKWIGIA